jgi:RHS repeat-associated protein
MESEWGQSTHFNIIVNAATRGTYASRQLSETQALTSGPTGTFTYQYDSDGNLTRHTRPDGSFIDYAYNARNLLASLISDAPPPVATYTYNARNQIASTVVENGLFTATRSYDAAGRLTGITHSRSVGVPPTSSTTTYNANAVNQYTTISGSGFQPPSYDPNGNQINSTIRPLGSSSLVSCVFSWNIHNELITATTAGTASPSGPSSATYQYDALGRRVRASYLISNIQSQISFFHNGWNVELEHDGSTWSSRHTWGIDVAGASGSGSSMQGAGGVGGLIMVETQISQSPIPNFPCYDGNGNITAWVNASGTVTARQRYDAFGNIIEQTGTAPSNYGFSTKPQDQVTGFLYYGYRYFDPLTGRWPSRDSIEEEGGINLYGFVGNEPIDNRDYLGQFTIPSYINDGIVVSGFKKRVSKLASRLTGRTLATWNSYNNCCNIRYESKIDSGTVDVVTDIFYYNPPASFGDAIVENILEKLIDEAAGNLAQRNAYAYAVYNGSQVIYNSIRESSIPIPNIDDNTILLGEENERYENFVKTTAGTWTLTTSDSFFGLTQTTCEALTTQGTPTITIQP